MLIRRAKKEDIDNVAELIADFRVELKKLKEIKSKRNIEYAKEEFLEYMNSNFPIYIGEEDNNIYGYIVCRVDGNIVWAESIYVKEENRRNGLATKLYKKVENLAESFGEETVYNWVHPNNHKIIPFLIKNGYNVLNLIEIRKPFEKEKLDYKIKIEEYEYLY